MLRVLVGLCLYLAWLGLAYAEPGLEFAGATDVGQKRQRNEDAILMRPALGFFVVADGMGGHAAGDVASAIAIETLADFADKRVQQRLRDFWSRLKLYRMIEATFAASHELANRAIMTNAMANPERRGMGTTIVSLLRLPWGVSLVNLGDSRAYRIRQQKIERITRDHSLLQRLIDEGQITTQAEIEAFPYKHILERAAGLELNAQYDVYRYALQAGDIFLLSSDGVFDELRDEEILSIVLASSDDFERAVAQLIQAANAKGGRDNISAILLRFAQP